jgi:signal peptidase I
MEPPAERSSAELLTRVGPEPRAAITVALHDPVTKQWLAGIDALLPVFGGGSFTACGVDFTTLESLRVAVGAPLTIAAELDGAIASTQVRCLLGKEAGALLARAQLEVRDRPGGVSITRAVPPRAAAGPSANAQHLLARCAGKAACGSAVLGPPGHELVVAVALSGQQLTVRIGGPGMARDLADAFVGAVAADPGLAKLIVHRTSDELVATFQGAADLAAAQVLKDHLLEAFRLPSTSMVPTLLLGDNVFVLKGALRGRLQPGDVVVFRHDDRPYIKRILAIGGQTVTETEDGISIDGVPLAAETIDPSYRYTDLDSHRDVGEVHEARLVRERLAGKAHRIVRSHEGGPGGAWTVPPGNYFLVGDNRENSHDSRVFGPVADADIVGRVLGVWFASRDGVPDWDRIGVPLDGP